MVTLPRYDNVLSAGNIIQILAFLVAFAVAWGSSHQRLNAVEEAQRSLVMAGIEREARIRAMEIASTRADARIDNLLESMDELKQAQRETNSLLRSFSQDGAK